MIVVTYVLLFIRRCIFLSFIIEKTLRNNGTQSIILVSSDYEIVEPVALYLEYLEKKGNSLNTIESYCRVLKEYFNWLSHEKMKFYEVSKHYMFSWIEYIELHAGKKQKKSARTIKKYLAAIGSFYDYFEGMGGYIENPIKVIQSSTKSYWKTFNVTKDQVGVNFRSEEHTSELQSRRLFQNEVDS